MWVAPVCTPSCLLALLCHTLRPPARAVTATQFAFLKQTHADDTLDFADMQIRAATLEFKRDNVSNALDHAKYALYVRQVKLGDSNWATIRAAQQVAMLLAFNTQLPDALDTYDMLRRELGAKAQRGDRRAALEGAVCEVRAARVLELMHSIQEAHARCKHAYEVLTKHLPPDHKYVHAAA